MKPKKEPPWDIELHGHRILSDGHCEYCKKPFDLLIVEKKICEAPGSWLHEALKLHPLWMDPPEPSHPDFQPVDMAEYLERAPDSLVMYALRFRRQLICYASLSMDEKRNPLFVNEERVFGYAIFQAAADRFSLVGYAPNWNYQSKTEHSTLDESKDYAGRRYENIKIEWRTTTFPI